MDSGLHFPGGPGSSFSVSSLIRVVGGVGASGGSSAFCCGGFFLGAGKEVLDMVGHFLGTQFSVLCE